MPAPVRLLILGGFQLSLEGREVAELPRKARALLAYLAVHQDRQTTRETAGELLWSDRGPEQVRHSLRQTLAVLRKLFRDRELVRARDGALFLSGDVESDAGRLLQLTADSDREAMRRAAEAYTGQLLDGFPPVSKDFDDWLMLTRARLETTVLRVLGRLADEATKAGDAQSALTATDRMFAIDPLREDTHRRLLEACAAAGRRSEALRHYATIVDVLHRELSVVPARETRELAQRLRREMDPLPEGGNPPASMAPATAIDAGSVPPIAVLPFRQLGDQPVAGHLAEGLVADVVCQLAGLRELRVISHGTTLCLTDPGLDARSAGRLLGVRYVVTGSMRRSGNSVRPVSYTHLDVYKRQVIALAATNRAISAAP